MNWYQGGIAQAIAESKTKGAIFVVYIEGKDDKSTQITQLVNGEEISAKLGSDKFVAIKVEAGSVPHQQFSQIYKQPPVPSVYFIGKQGTPLEIITEAKDSQSLSEKLDLVLQKGGLSSKPSQQSNDFITNERQQTAQASVPPNVVCENDVCTIKKDAPSTSRQSTSEATVEEAKPTEVVNELSPEEKVERAKELVEKKRLEKQKEEEEKERQKEIDRRKMGQNVQQMKRWQEDQELKQVLEERERDRKEGQAARDRVLAQIAQDKAERASRFSNSTPTPSQPQVVPQQSTPRPSNSNTARLQFRMPDGRSSTQDFPSSDTFEAVHGYIRSNLNLPFANYKLSTTFPRREFTDEDRSLTLLDLELVPTAVILILPISRGTVSTNPGGGFTSMLWTLISPLINLLGYLKTFVFGSAETSSGPSNSTNGNKRAAGPSNERVLPKRRAGESTVIRRGNVHRLSNRTDSDDENNTWNGNSTQQM